MLTITIEANTITEYLLQLREALGGTLDESWGEHTLRVSNEKANGTLRIVEFEWGGSILDYDITFHEEVRMVLHSGNYNPIHFIYCLKGHAFQKFGSEDFERTFEQYQSIILSSTQTGRNIGYFPAGVHLRINSIRINRDRFVQSRRKVVDSLNRRLYEVFHDTSQSRQFTYLGSYNLGLAPLVELLFSLNSSGLIRFMQMEGLIFQILSAHISDHEDSMAAPDGTGKILSRELLIVRELAQEIAENPAGDYSLESLAGRTGLSQFKLQEGLKKLYGRTVSDYVRFVRLESARNLLRNSDWTISEIVYSVGFNNRSYFSDIFKRQYGISPSDFKRKLRSTGTD